MIRRFIALAFAFVLAGCAHNAQSQQYVQPVAHQAGGLIHHPSDCDIVGRPDLQNLKGLTREQCASIAQLAGNRSVGAAGTPQAPAKPKLPTYGAQATVRDGHTCAHTLNGEVVVDYFDKTRNPEGIELPSKGAGPRCQQMKRDFMNKHGLS